MFTDFETGIVTKIYSCQVFPSCFEQLSIVTISFNRSQNCFQIGNLNLKVMHNYHITDISFFHFHKDYRGEEIWVNVLQRHMHSNRNHGLLHWYNSYFPLKGCFLIQY